MAAKVLKDMIICSECGEKMFPCAFDRENRKIAYSCLSCGDVQEYDFEEVALGENEHYYAFCLNDDGDATWKCSEHGYCEFPIENLFEMDYSKLGTYCCLLAKTEEEITADIEYGQSKGRDQIQQILSRLDEDQINELADELLLEVDIDTFEGNLIDAFAMEASMWEEGFVDFLYQMMERIDDFEIYLDIDSDGNITER